MPLTRSLALVFVLAASATAQPPRILIRAGHIVDVRTGHEPPDQTIVVTGDRIAAVAATASTPALPGLIDFPPPPPSPPASEPPPRPSTAPVREALNGVRFAKITLEAGF